MNCADLRDAYLRGEHPSGEAVEHHIADCEACGALWASPTLGSWLALPIAPSAALDPALEARVAATLDHERGLRARLRSLPTQLRVALSLGLCAVLAGVQVLFQPPAELGPSLWLSALALAPSVALLLATARATPGWQKLLLFMVAAELPLFCIAYFKESAEASGFEAPLRCFAYGALFSLPLLAWVLLAERRNRVPPLDAALTGASLGLLATMVLELDCASTNPAHLLFGHVSIGWVFIALLGAGAYLRRLSKLR